MQQWAGDERYVQTVSKLHHADLFVICAVSSSSPVIGDYQPRAADPPQTHPPHPTSTRPIGQVTSFNLEMICDHFSFKLCVLFGCK